MTAIKTKKEAIRNGDLTYLGHECERGHKRRLVENSECYYCQHSKKVIAKNKDGNKWKAIALLNQTKKTLTIQATADHFGVTAKVVEAAIYGQTLSEKAAVKILEAASVPVEVDFLERHKGNLMYQAWC